MQNDELDCSVARLAKYISVFLPTLGSLLRSSYWGRVVDIIDTFLPLVANILIQIIVNNWSISAARNGNWVCLRSFCNYRVRIQCQSAPEWQFGQVLSKISIVLTQICVFVFVSILFCLHQVLVCLRSCSLTIQKMWSKNKYQTFKNKYLRLFVLLNTVRHCPSMVAFLWRKD